VSTDRVYRKALPFDAAVEEIRRYSGTRYDPQVVEAFVAQLDRIKAVVSEG
jgi:HD-GYP domain-containing protein (c-di-GMP phosphodiesterase class II)